MQRFHFHNSKLIGDNADKKKTHQTQYLDKKIVVDINKLLNRVKIEERNETKRKIIFFSLVTLSLSFVGICIVAIK